MSASEATFATVPDSSMVWILISVSTKQFLLSTGVLTHFQHDIIILGLEWHACSSKLVQVLFAHVPRAKLATIVVLIAGARSSVSPTRALPWTYHTWASSAYHWVVLQPLQRLKTFTKFTWPLRPRRRQELVGAPGSTHSHVIHLECCMLRGLCYWQAETNSVVYGIHTPGWGVCVHFAHLASSAHSVWLTVLALSDVQIWA